MSLLNRRVDSDELFYEAMLEKLSYIETHTSKTAERLGTGVYNNVLDVSTRTIPTEGYIALAWQTTCGAIEVQNPGNNTVTIVNSMASGTRPTIGTGVSHVQAGTYRIVNVNSRFVTIYGTAGDQVGIQAFTVGGAGSGALF